MIFENNVVIASDLNDAWRNTLWCIVRNGYDYKIEGGSYVGQIRKQLPYFMLQIERPQRPFNFYTPAGIPEPTNEERINKYFEDYIITSTRTDNEDYNYSDYIILQYEKIIDILNKTNGNTNQAIITVGEPASIRLDDPPCLRSIHFTKIHDTLHMSIYFRSWDAYSGLPENLGGLQLFKEFILSNLKFDIQDGGITAYSSGIHVYEMYFDIVDCLNVDKIKKD